MSTTGRALVIHVYPVDGDRTFREVFKHTFCWLFCTYSQVYSSIAGEILVKPLLETSFLIKMPSSEMFTLFCQF